MPVPMHKVQSTNISYLGWQDKTLYITFHNGKKYKYKDVPESVFNTLKSASSVGGYFNRAIKGVYDEEEI